jgi:hypothetical protein
MILFCEFLDETTKLFFSLSSLMGQAFADVKEKEATMRKDQQLVETNC